MIIKISIIRKIWRRLLSVHYNTERIIISDLEKIERYCALVCRFPIQKNKIVMDNINGRGYGENPKYIAEELLKRKKHYKLIWLTNDTKEQFPEGIIPVYRYSLRAYYEHATAKVWVYNVRFGKLTAKRSRQILLQTWHGGLALKKVEKDAEEKLSVQYVKDAREDGYTADGILVDSKPNEDLFIDSFWLGNQCELLKYGSPRVDVLIKEKDNNSIKNRVRKILGISEKAFFVLYAPTFRSHYTIKGYIANFDPILKAFEERFGETKIVYRFHPVAHHLTDAMSWGSACAIDATNYPDVQELILAADCVITDYSSIAYDFAILRKPVFLCVKDLDDYLNDRGVYDIFYHQPFTLNTSEEMLVNEIRTCSIERMKERIDQFYDKYPSYNQGDASKRTVDWLEQKIKER